MRLVKMSDKDYFAHPAINQSSLKYLDVSPGFYLDKTLNPDPPTASMKFGSAFHQMLLEPQDFKHNFIVSQYGRMSQAFKDQEQNTTKHMITKQEWESMQVMYKNAKEHPLLSSMLNESKKELANFWTDPQTGLECKAKYDCIHNNYILDVKTTRDASLEAFTQSVLKYWYDVQGAWYLDGFDEGDMNLKTFYWAACESVPPYRVGLYKLSPNDYESGKHFYSKWLAILHKCKKEDSWPNQDHEIREIIAGRKY